MGRKPKPYPIFKNSESWKVPDNSRIIIEIWGGGGGVSGGGNTMSAPMQVQKFSLKEAQKIKFFTVGYGGDS